MQVSGFAFEITTIKITAAVIAIVPLSGFGLLSVLQFI
jgi:hypothetical protein